MNRQTQDFFEIPKPKNGLAIDKFVFLTISKYICAKYNSSHKK